MAARRRCRHRLLLFKIKVRPVSCESYPICRQSKVRWRFCKILWPSQNTYMNFTTFAQTCSKKYFFAVFDWLLFRRIIFLPIFNIKFKIKLIQRINFTNFFQPLFSTQRWRWKRWTLKIFKTLVDSVVKKVNKKVFASWRTDHRSKKFNILKKFLALNIFIEDSIVGNCMKLCGKGSLISEGSFLPKA